MAEIPDKETTAPERDETAESEGNGRFRVPRTRQAPVDVEQTEIVRGAKPGSRYARVTRSGDRHFQRGEEEGVFTATKRATAPRSAAARAWERVRRVAVGSPISSEHLEDQRLPKSKALAVFSSDALSSSAYATDEILLVLVTAGTAALVWSVPIACAIALLLAVVTFSYRQTIHAYPSGGGAYIVARDNLGELPAQAAGAALLTDYILTVAVSISSGVAQITSAYPFLFPSRVELAVGFVLLAMLITTASMFFTR